MAKVLLGVDIQGQSDQAINLIKRLNFARIDLELIHVVDVTLPISPVELVASVEVSTAYAEAVNKAGHAAMERSSAHARALGLAAHEHVLHGPPALCLVEEAERHKADIVAVGSQAHGALQSFVMGSMARALTIDSKASVLVAKGDVAEAGALSVVFGIDHSDYCRRSIEMFLKLAPKGVKKVTLASAYQVDEVGEIALHTSLAALGQDVDQWLDDNIRKRTEALAERFRAARYEADVQVRRGNTNEILRKAMDDTKADLMVVGAQGHGFMDRLVIGSVSLHQVVAENYHVLVLREDQAAAPEADKSARAKSWPGKSAPAKSARGKLSVAGHLSAFCSA